MYMYMCVFNVYVLQIVFIQFPWSLPLEMGQIFFS